MSDENRAKSIEEFLLEESGLDKGGVVEDIVQKKLADGAATVATTVAYPVLAPLAFFGLAEDGKQVITEVTNDFVDEYFSEGLGKKIVDFIVEGWESLSKAFAGFMGEIFGDDTGKLIGSIEADDIKSSAVELVKGAGLVVDGAFEQDVESNVYKNADSKAKMMAAAINEGFDEAVNTMSGMAGVLSAGVTARMSNFFKDKQITEEIVRASHISEKVYMNIYEATVGMLKNEYRQAHGEKGDIAEEDLLRISQIAMNTASQYTGVEAVAIERKGGKGVKGVEFRPIKDSDGNYQGLFKLIHDGVDEEVDKAIVEVRVPDEDRELSASFRESLNDAARDTLKQRQALFIRALAEVEYNRKHGGGSSKFARNDTEELAETMGIPDDKVPELVKALDGIIESGRYKNSEPVKIEVAGVSVNFDEVTPPNFQAAFSEETAERGRG